MLNDLLLTYLKSEGVAEELVAQLSTQLRLCEVQTADKGSTFKIDLRL